MSSTLATITEYVEYAIKDIRYRDHALYKKEFAKTSGRPKRRVDQVEMSVVRLLKENHDVATALDVPMSTAHSLKNRYSTKAERWLGFVHWPMSENQPRSYKEGVRRVCKMKEWHIELLGTMSDKKLARIIGCSGQAVGWARSKRGIARFCGPGRPKSPVCPQS